MITADNLIKDNAVKSLLIIECKTPGREFDRAWRNTLQDGDQLFSYAQQIAETQFLCLYASDFDGGALRYTSHIVAHRDNEKYLDEKPEFKGFKAVTDVKERFAVWQLFLQQKFFTNNDFSFIDVHNERLFYQNADVLLKLLQMWQDIRLTDTGGHNQFLGDLFEGFLDQGVKQREGQYFTPRAIDYACGAGHFLNEPALPLPEQRRFVAKIETLERTIAEAQGIIAAAPARKHAIMQRYL